MTASSFGKGGGYGIHTLLYPSHKRFFSERITKGYRSFATLTDREAMMKGGEYLG